MDPKDRPPRYDFALVTSTEEEGGSMAADISRSEAPSCYGRGADMAFSTEGAVTSRGAATSLSDLCLQTQASRDGFSTPQGVGRNRKPNRFPSSSGASSRSPSSVGRGTITSSTTGQGQRSSLVALVEGRGLAKGEIGMASMDVRGSRLILSQFPDDASYSRLIQKLELYNPLEMIVPNTVDPNSDFFKTISQLFPQVGIYKVERKYFNETSGINYVRSLGCAAFSSVEMEVKDRYYCLSAAAALLKYTEYLQNIAFAPKSLKITFAGTAKSMMIDPQTAKSLELLVNISDNKSENSLFRFLNYTKTREGNCLLKSTLLEPSSDEVTIQTRLDCVNELSTNLELYTNLSGLLVKFLDTEHILASVVQLPRSESVKTAEHKIETMVYLKHTLGLVDEFRQALARGEHALFQSYADMLNDSGFHLMMEMINQKIHEDCRLVKGALNFKILKCFAVKHENNALLDLARKTYSETIDDISAHIQELTDRHRLELKMGYTVGRGYYVQFLGTVIQPHRLPVEFVKVTQKGKTLSATTNDLIKFNNRVTHCLEEIHVMSNVILIKLLSDLRQHMGILHKLSESIATIDMIVSLTHASSVHHLTKPSFGEDTIIKNGRHPILLKSMKPLSLPVPNDTMLSEESNFTVVTGPNMSGKSVYLKQVAILQIMAQCGSFVPATEARFRIADQVFSRVGSDDDIETNCSTFFREMKEVQYILQNMTERSLIIVDELGRGTSEEEGVGLCFAISEHLLNSKAFTLFATHFLNLAQLEDMYPNVENVHFEVQHIHDTLREKHHFLYTHVMLKGPTQETKYGLKLAQLTALPKEVLEDAEKILNEAEAREKPKKLLNTEMRLKYKLGNHLGWLAKKSSNLDEATVRKYLIDLKKEYVENLQKVRAEAAADDRSGSETGAGDAGSGRVRGEGEVRGTVGGHGGGDGWVAS